MPGQLVADKVDFLPNQFQQLQPLPGCDREVVQLDDRMVELPGSLADVGHGQLLRPLAEGLRRRVAKGEGRGFLFRYTQVRFQNRAFHEFAPMLGSPSVSLMFFI